VARRGFFAELQHQAQVADKRRRQQQAAGRASQAERARMDKEAARLHVESRLAEVTARNAALAGALDEIDGLLATTLAVDDYVDLQALMITVKHPPFTPGHLAVPTPDVPPLVYPPEPAYQEPPPPGGLFGAKKKHEQAVQRARAEFEAARQQWHEYAVRMHAEHLAAQQRREQTEAARVMRLAEAKQRYELECGKRDADAAAHNAKLTELINGLAFDVEAAIAQYVDIVLSNSVYPDAFPGTHDDHFDLATRELTLTTTVPPPSSMPTVKEYRYVRAKDEITSSTLSMKEQKDRYASAVFQVAVRTLHEVFEADRSGKIRSITLTVVTHDVSPATGIEATIPLVVAAADRDTFTGFDLANVVPRATLEHLGAALSKAPLDLAPADTSRGVRQRGR